MWPGGRTGEREEGSAREIRHVDHCLMLRVVFNLMTVQPQTHGEPFLVFNSRLLVSGVRLLA